MNPPKRIPLKFQEIADPQVFKWYQALVNKLGEVITTAKGLRIEFPKIYTVQGSVKVTDLPRVQIDNFPDLSSAFKSIALGINNMQESLIKAISSQKLEVPKSTSIDGDVSMRGMKDLLEGIEELKKGFNILIKATQESRGTDTSKPLAVEIVKDLPRPIPLPVTNVNINGLQGFSKTTAATVTTALTPLPTYGQLFNRRSMIIFNNDSSTTVYIGGSDLTSANGLPILAQSYSPAIDAGYNLHIYGRTTSGSVDVRVMEVSNNQQDSLIQ